MDVNAIMEQARGGKDTMPVSKPNNEPQSPSKPNNEPQDLLKAPIAGKDLDVDSSAVFWWAVAAMPESELSGDIDLTKGWNYKYSETDLKEIMKKPFNKISREEMEHIRKYKEDIEAKSEWLKDWDLTDGKKVLTLDDRADNIMESASYDDLEAALKIFFPKENPKDVIVRMISNSLNK